MEWSRCWLGGTARRPGAAWGHGRGCHHPPGYGRKGDVPPTLGNRGVVVGAAPMGAAGSPAGQNTSAKGDLGAFGEPPRMCKGGIQMCPGAPKILWDAPVSFGVPPRCVKAAQIRQVPPKMLHLPPFFCAFSTPCATAPPVVPRTPWSHSPGFGKVGAQWDSSTGPLPTPTPPWRVFWGILGLFGLQHVPVVVLLGDPADLPGQREASGCNSLRDAKSPSSLPRGQ